MAAVWSGPGFRLRVAVERPALAGLRGSLVLRAGALARAWSLSGLDQTRHRRRVGQAATFDELAKLGEQFFYAMAGIQLSLVILAAPAAAAGSICTDRARGTLEHMMVTDLSDVEIVLGKLAARLAPIVGMIMCGVPVAALATLLGGVEFRAIAGLFVVSLSLALLGCALALAISIWAAKTHEVLLAVYVIESVWLLSLPIWYDLSFTSKLAPPPVWFEKANPYVLVFAPYAKPGFARALDYAAFAGVVLAVSTVLAIVSIARLRRVIVAWSSRRQKGPRRLPDLKWLLPSWPSPTLDGNPVLWREWHYSRPSRLAWWLWTGMLVLAWSLVAWGTHAATTEGVGPGGANGIAFGFLLVLLFGLLMLSAMAPTALAEERARGSLDVLLATPLSTREIVIAKWWGVYRKALVLAPLPLYVGIFMAASIPELPIWATSRPYNPPLIPINDQRPFPGSRRHHRRFPGIECAVGERGPRPGHLGPPAGPGGHAQRDCVFRHGNRLDDPGRMSVRGASKDAIIRGARAGSLAA